MRGGNLLYAEGRIFCEFRRVEEEEFVRSAEIAGEEVGEYAAGAVEGRRVGVVGLVPGVLERGEGLGRVFCAEDEMALCIVGFEIYTCSSQLTAII
jgi:hypothetical protein